MTIPVRDIKLLWGRSGNRCAICKLELSEDKAIASEAYPLGEQAHIVAEADTGKRGKSALTLTERNAYHNLILLCPTDHTRVDNDEVAYPIERLHMIKTDHEDWVRSRLAESDVDPRLYVAQQVYASLIDKAASSAALADWYDWTSYALGPEPEWDVVRAQSVRTFRRSVIRAIWSALHPELESAIKHFSVTLSEAAERFREHCNRDGDVLHADMFYRRANDQYDEKHRQFEEWVDSCHTLIFESTKAANWLADCVRRFVNPSFFAVEGKFIIAYESLFTVNVHLMEYTQDEIAELRRKYEML